MNGISNNNIRFTDDTKVFAVFAVFAMLELITRSGKEWKSVNAFKPQSQSENIERIATLLCISSSFVCSDDMDSH